MSFAQDRAANAAALIEAREREEEEVRQKRGENPKDRLGVKKPPVHLVPAAGVLRVAEVMRLGAEKYGPYNWRKNNVNHTVYLSAAMRHIYAALDGESVDPESGQPHEAHAAACLLIVLDAMAGGQLAHDLPNPGPAARVIKTLTKD